MKMMKMKKMKREIGMRNHYPRGEQQQHQQ